MRHALLLWIPAVFSGSGCAAAPLERYEFAAPKMGTEFRLVLYASDVARAEAAATAAFGRLDELNAILSDYDPESELARLSRASDARVPTDWVSVSSELFDVLERAQALARETGGAFDVTVGPYVRLWRRARRQGVLPDEERLASVRGAVGYAGIQLDRERRAVRLLAPGMRLDLGGIAKGYAVDAVLDVLCARGIDRALVDGGGDIAVGRPPPEQHGWLIALSGPGGIRISLEETAVATSGDLERFVEVDGVRYSHLVDPRTGRASTERLLVTVVAPRGIDADALASAVSVLGAVRGIELIGSLPGAEARVVRLSGGEGRVSRTPGFPPEVSSSER